MKYFSLILFSLFVFLEPVTGFTQSSYYKWEDGKCAAYTGDHHFKRYVLDNYCGGYSYRWEGGKCAAYTGDGHFVRYLLDGYCD